MTGFHADAAGVVGPAEVVDAHDLRLAGEFDADSSGSLGTNLLDEAPDDRVVSAVAVGQRNSPDHDVLSNVVADAISAARDDQSSPDVRADLTARDPPVTVGAHSDSLVIPHIGLSQLTQALIEIDAALCEAVDENIEQSRLVAALTVPTVRTNVVTVEM